MIEFRRVQDIMSEDENFQKNSAITLPKRNEIDIVPLIPLKVSEELLKIKKFLYLHVALTDQNVQVMVDSLLGLETVEGNDEYANQLLLQFEYFHPKRNILEEKPRQVLVTDIYYGIHPNHEGEKADFYFVGEDTQYTDRPKQERERYFPFWRVGLYGKSEEQLPIFLLSKVRSDN